MSVDVDAAKIPLVLVFRRTLIVFMCLGGVWGYLDVLHILTDGDLVTRPTLFIFLALNLVLIGLGGGLASTLFLRLLPRKLGLHILRLTKIGSPGKAIEIVFVTALLASIVLLVPLKNSFEKDKLEAELASAGTRMAAVDESGTFPSRAEPAPSVIILILDTVRADHLSLYGYDRPTTPNIERWSEECLVYQTAVSVAPWTVPAHATLFTGLYPYQHGARNFLPDRLPANKQIKNSFGLKNSLKTLAEIFSEHGYNTGAEVSNPFLSPTFGFDQGFTTYRYHPNKNYRLHLRSEKLYRWLVEDRWNAVFNKPQQNAYQLNRRILNWLEHYGDQPFFLFANYMDAHLPYHSPPPYSRRFPGRLKDFEYSPAFEAAIMGGQREITAQEEAHLHSGYDGAIQYLDHQLGRLFAQLRALDLYDNTLIVLTSDHGEFFGEHQLLQHNKDVYQEVLDIPLLIKCPRGDCRGTNDARANLVDLFPTILRAAGLEPPPGLPGMNLLGEMPQRQLLAENYFAQFRDLKQPYGFRFARVRRALYHENWKFIFSSDGVEELYDLSSEPHEQDNLIDEMPELAETFRLIWERMNNDQDPTTGADPEELDEATRRRLKALGYL